jgi:hypothetical protein
MYKPDDQGYFSKEENRFHPWIHNTRFLTANGHTTRRTIFEYLHQLWVPGTDAITVAKEKQELGRFLSTQQKSTFSTFTKAFANNIATTLYQPSGNV